MNGETNWAIFLAVIALLEAVMLVANAVDAIRKPSKDANEKQDKKLGDFSTALTALTTSLNGVTIRLNVLIDQFDVFSTANTNAHTDICDSVTKLHDTVGNHETRITVLEKVGGIENGH